MDPLSASASVVGLIGGATRVIMELTKLAGAPHVSKDILSEARILLSIFAQLKEQSLLPGHQTAIPGQNSMVFVDQIRMILKDCVVTLAELQAELNAMPTGTNSAWDRWKWTTSEHRLRRILAHLQSQKISLTLILSIQSCQSHTRALRRVEQLSRKVDQLLEQSQSWYIPEVPFQYHPTSGFTPLHRSGAIVKRRRSEAYDQKSPGDTKITSTLPYSGEEPTMHIAFRPPFEETLRSTRVYTRALRRNGSFRSSSTRKTNWTGQISGVSLTNISNVSVLALPIFTKDFGARYNARRSTAFRTTKSTPGSRPAVERKPVPGRIHQEQWRRKIMFEEEDVLGSRYPRFTAEPKIERKPLPMTQTNILQTQFPGKAGSRMIQSSLPLPSTKLNAIIQEYRPPNGGRDSAPVLRRRSPRKDLRETGLSMHQQSPSIITGSVKFR